jgi:intracellular sulfur oxidation DsrE/DsrF family protein
MKRTIGTVVTLLAMALAAISQTPKPHKHRVVIEMSLATPDAWAEAEGHIRVLRDSFPNDVDIELVSMGEGVPMLSRTDTELQAEMQRDADAGVVFIACQRSMRARKLTTADLFPFVRQVPSGVAEVVMKQEAGYSYLKASYDAPFESHPAR